MSNKSPKLQKTFLRLLSGSRRLNSTPTPLLGTRWVNAWFFVFFPATRAAPRKRKIAKTWAAQLWSREFRKCLSDSQNVTREKSTPTVDDWVFMHMTEPIWIWWIEDCCWVCSDLTRIPHIFLLRGSGKHRDGVWNGDHCYCYRVVSSKAGAAATRSDWWREHVLWRFQCQSVEHDR